MFFPYGFIVFDNIFMTAHELVFPCWGSVYYLYVCKTINTRLSDNIVLRQVSTTSIFLNYLLEILKLEGVPYNLGSRFFFIFFLYVAAHF